jgi:endonuclease/exonuclease/phosphatase (EEP) superfamily protein YafD
LAKRYPNRTTCAEPQLCSTMILAKQKPVAEGGFDPHVSPTRLSAAWARFGPARTGFTVVGVHYRWPIPAGRQQVQSERLAKAIDGFNNKSLIIAGDFNSTPWSCSLRRQDARFGLIRRTHALFSWPAAPFSHRRINSPLPFLPIDHVYAGADWRTVEVRRGPKLGSDHYPVVVTLTRERGAPR